MVVVAHPVSGHGQLGQAGIQAGTQHRDEDATRVVPVVPVDVEPAGEGGRRPVPQDRPPGGVLGLRLADRHVVGDDVDDEAHPGRVRGRDQAREGRLPAEVLVEPGMVDDVVAVCRARDRLQAR